MRSITPSRLKQGDPRQTWKVVCFNPGSRKNGNLLEFQQELSDMFEAEKVADLFSSAAMEPEIEKPT